MLRKDAFVPGEYYHIYNRGIDKRIIFKSIHDYQRFMMLLYAANSDQPIKLDNLINILHKKYEEIFSCDRGKQLVSIGTWCLMPNHFHLLVREEAEDGITQFMKKLGTAYSMYFNIKYQRTGSLFGGPFKSKNISNDKYLKHLFGYISLNPLDLEFPEWEGLVEKQNSKVWRDFLKKYRYSSYFDYIGIQREENSILNMEAFPKYFSTHKDFEDFIESYLSFDPSTS
ncbi:transposase [Candidatus Nomurabacteria bacterium]|nr:transposase [Candidatus Nomurabacteria bacterium]